MTVIPSERPRSSGRGWGELAGVGYVVDGNRDLEPETSYSAGAAVAVVVDDRRLADQNVPTRPICAPVVPFGPIVGATTGIIVRFAYSKL